MHENWLEERGEQFRSGILRSGIQIATLDPFQGQKERIREAFVADEAYISVDVAYLHRASARGLPPSHTRPRPTPAAHLIQRLPACPIPEIARLGRTLRKWKDAFLSYFDTDGASNGPTEAINGHYRAGQTHRQRLPQPHQLPTPNAPHRRRPRCLHPHSTLKSPITRRSPAETSPRSCATAATRASVSARRAIRTSGCSRSSRYSSGIKLKR